LEKNHPQVVFYEGGYSEKNFSTPPTVATTVVFTAMVTNKAIVASKRKCKAPSQEVLHMAELSVAKRKRKD